VGTTRGGASGARPTRSAAGRFGGDGIAAELTQDGGDVTGQLSVRVGGAEQVYRVTAALGWDNTGSTGFRGTGTRGSGETARLNLVLSGAGHLHVELFHRDGAAAVSDASASSSASAAVSDRHVFDADRGSSATGGATVVATTAPTGTAPTGAAPTGAAPYPELDVYLEQIAHVYAYRDALDPTAIETLRGWGWEVVPHGDLHGSMWLLALRPIAGHDPRRPPVLAFRGTVPTEAADWLDDGNPAGVGMYQYTRNEAEILAMLTALGGGVTVTGHSLGGALAQITAGMLSNLVAHVVTFQAPGVSAGLVENIRAHHIDSRHHVVEAPGEGDIVSSAGEAHSDGEVFHHHAAGVERVDHYHTSLPLAEEAVAAGTAPEGTTFPTGGTRIGYTAPSAGGVTVDHEDPSNGVYDYVRFGIGGVLGAVTEEWGDVDRGGYTMAWLDLRAAAGEGRTTYRELCARITAVPEAARDGLRANLDAMFPELRAATPLEARVSDGTFTTPDAFADAVAATGVSLDDTRRARLFNLFDRLAPAH
jgi:pimeloyl-ACP methyl ester carboxylesterase